MRDVSRYGVASCVILFASVLLRGQEGGPVTASCVSIRAVQGVAIAPVTMTGSGGAGGPYAFSASGLPTGLTMSPNGTISGTPEENGTFPYLVVLYDSQENRGTVNCSVTVAPPPTRPSPTVSLTSSVNPSVYGQPVTFTATVTPPILPSIASFRPAVNYRPRQTAPTGTVAFFNNGSQIASVPLSGNQAQLTTSGLAVGSHAITAMYSGDSNYAPSTGAQTQVVNKANTTVSTPSVSGMPIVGQTLTFSAAVSVVAPGAGTPTGTVTFSDSGNPIGSAGVGSTFSTSSLAAGPHNITASYQGDPNFVSSSSGALTLTITSPSPPQPTTVSLTSSVNPSLYGQPVTFTATVTTTPPPVASFRPAATYRPRATTPTGTITLFDNGSQIASAPLTGNQAQFTTSGLAPGSHPITATYSGDTNYASSTSGALTQTVNKVQFNLTLSSSPNASTLGQPVTLTASFTLISGTGSPAGTVQFVEGTTLLGTATISAGQASIQVSTLTVGMHTITAQLAGGSPIAANSASVTQVVNRIPTILTLSASAPQILSTQSLTLTAALSPAPPAGVAPPTGQITIQDGNTTLGTLNAASGGSIAVQNLSVGTHQIQAAYPGDSNWAPATASVTVMVVAALTITTSSLANATVGSPYSTTLKATGGTTPYTWAISGLPPPLTGDATGLISGTPTTQGTSTISVKVTDATGASASATLTLTVVMAPLTITTASLPSGTVGSQYMQTVMATGGTPPYTWSVSGASNFSISASGVLSGTALPAGTISLVVTVTDSLGTTASKPFTVNVTGPLMITTASLPSGTGGLQYMQTVMATGGTAPYTWSGTLPTGLSIDPGTGAISGTVSPGTYVFTIIVKDSLGTSVTSTYSVNFAPPPLPAVNFSGPSTANPQSQPSVQIALASGYPLPVTGTLTLTFQANTGGDDQMVQFSAGGRTVPFTFAANSTSPVNQALQSGTTAGTITITATFQAAGADITPTPPPRLPIQVNPSPPVISAVEATRNPTGFTIAVTGYSSTREVSQVTFHFNAAVGTTLGTSDITIPVASLFAPWFQNSAAFGSQFLYTELFAASGNTQSVTSVTVTLVNSQGSQSATATIQ